MGNARKKKGDYLENMIFMLHQAFINEPHVRIKKNDRLRNIDNYLREFDITVRYTCCDYQMLIAIECKNYKKKVSVVQLEGFNGKCNDCPEITKKVFVSVEGYTSSCNDYAKRNGIELCVLEQLKPNQINDWVPFFYFKIKPKIISYDVSIFTTQKIINLLNINQNRIVTDKFHTWSNFRHYLEDALAIDEVKRVIYNSALSDHLSSTAKKQNLEFSEISIKIEPNNLFIIFEPDYLPIKRFNVTVQSKHILEPVKNVKNQQFKNGKIISQISSIDDKNTKYHLLNKGQEFAFYIQEENQTPTKMSLKWRYDPDLDKFIEF